MKATQKLTFSISPIVIIILLLAIIAGMLAVWRPWEGSRTQRTITVTGTAEVSATPDEFTFSPYFQRTGADAAKLKTELDTFGVQFQTKLESLGVPSNNITLNSNSYGQTSAAMPGGQSGSTEENTVTLAVTVKAPTKDLAQKIQDYLATTDAKGQLTAQPSLSKQKSLQVENQARDAATKDARGKADSTAKNLGGSVGKVISVKDAPSSSPVYPMAIAGGVGDSMSKASLPVTPGEDKVDFNVEVVFELR